MKNTILLILCAMAAAHAQNLSPKWDELTAADFVKALDRAQGVCLLPFGILEKHGPTGPIGTDLINVRYATFEAVKQEYAIVFREYYFGQIFEAKQQPGTIAYSMHLQLELLQETTAEMARNGCREVVIVSGHGGNGNAPPLPAAQPSKPGVDGHAGEAEMSSVMASRPDLVHPDRAATESGADLNRLDVPSNVYTGIWCYAKFPNHYQGDAAGANAARGTALVQQRTNAIANAIRAIKSDTAGPRLQKEFFDASRKPVETRQ